MGENQRTEVDLCDRIRSFNEDQMEMLNRTGCTVENDNLSACVKTYKNQFAKCQE